MVTSIPRGANAAVRPGACPSPGEAPPARPRLRPLGLDERAKLLVRVLRVLQPTAAVGYRSYLHVYKQFLYLQALVPKSFAFARADARASDNM
jgi:hypothetical protein